MRKRVGPGVPEAICRAHRDRPSSHAPELWGCAKCRLAAEGGRAEAKKVVALAESILPMDGQNLSRG